MGTSHCVCRAVFTHTQPVGGGCPDAGASKRFWLRCVGRLHLRGWWGRRAGGHESQTDVLCCFCICVRHACQHVEYGAFLARASKGLACAVLENHLYAVGGSRDDDVFSSKPAKRMRRVDKLRLGADRWTSAAPLTFARSHLGM